MEDTLEAYLLGRLPGQQMGREDDQEVQSVEEHLLWCEVCQMEAEAQEIEIRALRVALLIGTSAPGERKPAKARAMALALPTVPPEPL
jgi:hypothetical protein